MHHARSVLVAATLLGLAGCMRPGAATVMEGMPSLERIGGNDVLNLGPEPVAAPDDVQIRIQEPPENETETSLLRRQALMEAAQSYGSQMGYARRAWEIMNVLQSTSGRLDAVYDFRRVVSPAPAGAGVVIPPVVSRARDAYDRSPDGTEAAVADEYLTVTAPGRMLPVQPTWRNWLLFGTAHIERPAQSLWPRDRNELALFKTWFREGWEAGRELASEELGARLDRLNRDYTGMLQYRRLVALGMMDRMVIRDRDLGITGTGTEMRIGSRTVRIVSPAEFNLDASKWLPAVVSETDAQIVSTGRLPSMSDLEELLR